MKPLYLLGTVLLFFGLLWMFLPHTTHEIILHEQETAHVIHTLEGAGVAILGLGVMILSNKRKGKV